MADINIDDVEQVNERLVFHYYKEQFLITRAVANFGLSLDYLPCFQGDKGHWGYIVGTSNGLILCSNYYDLNRVTYYICNPVTKQWASIPPAPIPSISPCYHAAIGFVCDPNYRIDDHQGDFVLNPDCRFRILRAFGSSSPSHPEFDVVIFSSETGEWTSSKVLRDNCFWEGVNYSSRRMIAYNGKLLVQVGQSIVLYDPFTFKVHADINPPKENIFSGSREACVNLELKGGVVRALQVVEATERTEEDHEVVQVLDGFWCSRGSLWACQLRYETSTLYLWRLMEDDDSSNQGKCYWSLEKQVGLSDSLKDASLVKKCMLYGRVLTLHPDDPNMVYLCLSYQGLIVLWNLETGTLAVVDRCDKKFFSWADAFLLEVPAVPSID